MDRYLKERLIGATVLVVIGVWLIPWLLDGTDQWDDGTELGSSGMDSIREQTQTMVQTILLDGNHELKNQRNAIVLEETQSPLNGNLLSSSTTLAPESPKPESVSQSLGNSANTQSIFIQVGSFGDRENARRLMERVKSYGFDPQISTHSASGGVMYRVRVGPKFSQSEAEKVASSLSSHGFLVQIVGDE
jgi:cell division septation protein DedD